MFRTANVSRLTPHANFPVAPSSRALVRFLLRPGLGILSAWTAPLYGIVLWSDFGGTLAHDNGAGLDILAGAVKRDDSANDTLYFKFHVDPLSDSTTEEYFAAFELFDGQTERFGVGNALTAWAYSAFVNSDESAEGSKVSGYIDLHSSSPEPSSQPSPSNYEF